MERYSGRYSFVGFDLMNEAHMDGDIWQQYNYEAYRLIRKFSPNWLIFVSERYWWNNVETSDMWPRLSPDVTGIVIDMHRYTKRMNLWGMEYSTAKCEIEKEFTESALAIREHYITVTGEFSIRFDNSDDALWQNYRDDDS